MRKRDPVLILSVLLMMATPGLAAPALEATATWDKVTGEAIAAAQREDFEVAEKQFEKACKLAEQPGAAPEQLPSSLNGLARVKVELGNYKRAGELFSKALDLAKSSKAPNNLQIASIESDIGTMYSRQGKAPLAEPFSKPVSKEWKNNSDLETKGSPELSTSLEGFIWQWASLRKLRLCF